MRSLLVGRDHVGCLEHDPTKEVFISLTSKVISASALRQRHSDDTLYIGELVEPLGFDSIWATEHYGSAYSMQPNPLQYLAYWAGRTTRVDMGTAVIVAPWWNPV